MKNIFSIFILGLSLLISQPVLAGDGKNVTTGSDTDKKPSITIEFNDMDEVSDEFKELKEEFDGETIEINTEGSAIVAIVALLGIGMILFILGVALFAFIFWIVMLIHAIKSPIHSKALWILILLLFGIIGAIVYYFAVKRPHKKQSSVS